MTKRLLSLVGDAIAAKVACDPDSHLPRHAAISRLLILRDNVDDLLDKFGNTEPVGRPMPPKPWRCGAPTKAGDPCRNDVAVPSSLCMQHAGRLRRCAHPTDTGPCRSVPPEGEISCHHHRAMGW